MRRVTTLLVGALLISAVVWGCGGSGEDSDGSSNSGSSGSSKTSAPGSTESSDAEVKAEAEGGDGGGGAVVGSGPFDGPAVNGDASGSGAPLTKAQFIKQADDLCRKGGETIRTDIQRNKEAYGMGFGNQPNNKEREEVIIDIVIPVIAIQTAEIAALPAPEGEEDTVAAIIAALEKGVTVTEEDPSVAIKGPNPFQEASKLSQEYGFKVCQ